MKTVLKKVMLILMIPVITLIAISCKKESPGDSYMTVKMTDTPADYLAVNVEILGASVNIDNHGWIDVPVATGVYNLLSLQNDVTTTLATDVHIPPGHANQLRLLVGNNNTITTVNGTYSLKIPSGDESGIKINLNEDFNSSHHTVIVLDFDAGASVVENGSSHDSFSLKPVIKVKSISHS